MEDARKYTILVVEDEEGIRKAIVKQLQKQSYTVLGAKNGKEGLEIIKNNTVHLAIVDIMMPEMDGIEMTVLLRKKYTFPIIFLTAKSQDVDKVTGLMIGADDYMTKPFTFSELTARIYSHLRRYEMMKHVPQTSSNDVLQIGDIYLDSSSHEVRVADEVINLRPKEFSILELLMSNPNRVYSADQIYELIWNEEAISTQTVIVHVRRLREKIERDTSNPQYIKVVWGVGYKFVEGKT